MDTSTRRTADTIAAAADGSDPPGGPVSEEEIFRRLFESADDDVLRFVERRVHPLAAEDVVADVFLVAWRRLPDVPGSLDEARAWLFGVAQRTLANQRRGDSRRSSLAVRVGQSELLLGIHSGDHASDVAARTDLARAWSRLRAVDQEVLTLTALDGLTGRRPPGCSASAPSRSACV